MASSCIPPFVVGLFVAVGLARIVCEARSVRVEAYLQEAHVRYAAI